MHRDYVEQLSSLKLHDRSTLYVDFTQLRDHSPEVADAIDREYFQFEPTLRKAVHEFVKKYHPEHATEDKQFWVSFYRLDFTHKCACDAVHS